MGEGKFAWKDDEEGGSAVVKIFEETNRLLEKKRKRLEARKMRRLLKKCNVDVTHGTSFGLELMSETQVELDLDESEAEKLRKLQEMEKEIATGQLLTHVEHCGGSSKYEAPVIIQLRAVETVDELYYLADQIVQLPSKESSLEN